MGGYVADKILGNYRTIVYFAVPYVIGQAILGFSSLHTTTFLFLSLALLAIGSGMIKPNISTLMGLTYDQLRPGRDGPPQRRLRHVLRGDQHRLDGLDALRAVDPQLLGLHEPRLRRGVHVAGRVDGACRC